MTDDLPEVQEYCNWLALWSELTMIASGGFTLKGEQQPMTDEQRDAARTVPDVLDRLEEAWAMLPDSVRPSHFTYPVLSA